MRPTVPLNIPEESGLKVGCEGVLTKLLMLQISHFSIVITGQKRGNVSLAQIIVHAADNDFRFQLYRTFLYASNILFVDQSFDQRFLSIL